MQIVCILIVGALMALWVHLYMTCDCDKCYGKAQSWLQKKFKVKK